ncbi:MAG: hypothetical protein NUW37_07715 [Planctomycetes bacterium]|nr:hypothetical protein [Planctomycetota bacterium]
MDQASAVWGAASVTLGGRALSIPGPDINTTGVGNAIDPTELRIVNSEVNLVSIQSLLLGIESLIFWGLSKYASGARRDVITKIDNLKNKLVSHKHGWFLGIPRVSSFGIAGVNDYYRWVTISNQATGRSVLSEQFPCPQRMLEGQEPPVTEASTPAEIEETIDPSRPLDPQPGEDEFILPLGQPLRPDDDDRKAIDSKKSSEHRQRYNYDGDVFSGTNIYIDTI